MINFTLIVQALHFCIAWMMLKRFLWPQLLARYDAYKNRLIALEQDVVKAEQRVRLQQEQLTAEWAKIGQTCRRLVGHEKDKQLPLLIEPVELAPVPTAAELAGQVKPVAAALTRKMLDA